MIMSMKLVVLSQIILATTLYARCSFKFFCCNIVPSNVLTDDLCKNHEPEVHILSSFFYPNFFGLIDTKNCYPFGDLNCITFPSTDNATELTFFRSKKR